MEQQMTQIDNMSDAQLHQLVLALAERSKVAGLKLATAESCTGGGIAYAITAVPGSSDWFERGFVTYSNAAKEEMLAIPSATLTKFGAVSEEVARAMAEGALRHSHADISLSTTGIAGPSGDSVAKPIGLVWFAIASTTFATLSFQQNFSGDRASIRVQAIIFILQKLLEKLTGK